MVGSEKRSLAAALGVRLRIKYTQLYNVKPCKGETQVFPRAFLEQYAKGIYREYAMEALGV